MSVVGFTRSSVVAKVGILCGLMFAFSSWSVVRAEDTEQAQPAPAKDEKPKDKKEKPKPKPKEDKPKGDKEDKPKEDKPTPDKEEKPKDSKPASDKKDSAEKSDSSKDKSGDKGAKKDEARSKQPSDRSEQASDRVAQPPARNVPANNPSQPAGGQVPPRGGQPAGRGAAPKGDRISEMLKDLDPAALQLTGEVSVEIVNGQLVVVGNEQDVAAIEALLMALDEGGVNKVQKVVQVTQRDAKEIAQGLEQAIREGEKARPQEDQTSLRAIASNIILISAMPEDMDNILELIQQVDEVPDLLRNLIDETLIFDIKYRKASEVATQLKDLFKALKEKSGATGAKGEIKVVPNNVNNTILVIAPESERDKIQLLIDTIDVEPNAKRGGKSELVLFPLVHSKAQELAEVLDKLIKEEATSGQSSEDGREVSQLILRRVGADGTVSQLPPIDVTATIRIIPDDGTESLIIATIPDNIEPLRELIRLLDGVPLAANVDVRLFPLKFADAQALGEMITQMFEDGKSLPEDPGVGDVGAVPETVPGKSLVYNIGIASDQRSNTLIASGRPDQLQLVEKIVTDLDKPATALKFPLRMIPLSHTDATRISQLLKSVFEKRVETAEATETSGAALEREKVFLSVDILSNTIIASASPENMDEILSIVKQLDTAPAKVHEQIHIVTCQRLSVKDLKEKIDELWQRKTSLAGVSELPEDTPVLAIDERSNSLLVAAAPEDHAEIKRIVEALETQPMLSDTRLFKLSYVDATVLTDMLDKLFEGLQGASEAFQKPTIIPDSRSNTLVVAGTQDTMERVDYLVKRLDVAAGPTTAVFAVYPLRHGSASKLAPRMQELFDSRQEGEDAKRTPIVIFADEGSNSLVCSASRDDHETIVDLMGLLDQPSNIARQFEIFPMKYARATAVTEKMSTLFTSQGEGSSGRADAIATEADERTNSIIVWASPSEMTNIREVISKLDTDGTIREMQVKIIQLKQALAEDFATLLTETVIGENSGGDDEQAVILSVPVKKLDGTVEYRKMLRQDIKIKADSRTNSLMVMAPSDSMAMLEMMIQDFDKVRPITSEVRLFPLLNADAEAIVEKLNELFQTGDGGGGGSAAGDGPKSQLIFGDMPASEFDIASVGQDLRFAADVRTNTLIAAGAEVDLRMVEELVRYLDSQEAEDRLTAVIPVSYYGADALATALKSFNDQEQEVLGQTEDQESQRVKAERQISVESLSSETGGGEGGSGGGSSTLLIGVGKRRYDQTMEMIRQLDRPEPQVMISVLIAEVTLTDDVELGMEIAGRDLDFTDSAVLGPNGIIQGPDFDWVSGTDLGAAGLGLGGFNFTVTGEDFSFLMHAVQQDSRLEVLSRPVLLVRNGEEGKISISDDIPVVSSSQINDTGSVNSSVGREEVGIILTATPHISPDGYVTIDMKQEISNFSGENLQLTEGVSSPIISKREVDTNVTVRDGETVVIGGLITARESEAENKVPLLGDIPILGQLARFNSISTQKTELLVVLTVDVLRTDADLREMSVEQRDKYVLPDSIRQSPLMEGLRIKPEEVGMGPAPTNGGSKTPPAPAAPPTKGPDRDSYGPRPKTYGPVISPPSRSTTTTARPVYGPKVVRNDQAIIEEPLEDEVTPEDVEAVVSMEP